MTNNLKEVEKLVEEWGCEHLSGKFMFEPMWLRAKQDMVALINQKEKEAEIRGLENLLDGSAEGATCICESAGLSVCDHNWSLCNVVRDRIKQLKEELKEKQL